MTWRSFFELVKSSVREWSEDNASRLSAALAYYTVFSVAPLLVIIMSIVGIILGREEASGQVMQELQGVLGPQMASLLKGIAEQAQRPSSGIIAGIIGFAILIVGASGMFHELHSSLNIVWDVQRKTAKGIMGVVRTRISSFLIIFVVGLLFLVAVAASAAISAFGHLVEDIVPGTSYFLQSANFILFFLVTGVLFAVIYKILPDARIKWGDVWVGAGVTSLLFVIGKLLIGLYLGRSTVASPFGAAGSLVIMLAFVYYSAQIFFFGAEFTQIYANRFGSRVVPVEESQPMPGEEPHAEDRPSSPDKGAPTRKRVQGPGREPMPAGAVYEEREGEGASEGAVPASPWRAALGGFIGGIFAGMYLNRPRKPA